MERKINEGGKAIKNQEESWKETDVEKNKDR